MATIAEQIAALEEAAANGEREVRFGEQFVRYDSPAELRQKLKALRAHQEATDNGTRRPRVFRVNTILR